MSFRCGTCEPKRENRKLRDRIQRFTFLESCEIAFNEITEENIDLDELEIVRLMLIAKNGSKGFKMKDLFI